MIAAMTHLPVLGVPVQSKALSGQDSLLSIVQMPAGVPVGTLAIGEAGATNAGLMAAAILLLVVWSAQKVNLWLAAAAGVLLYLAVFTSFSLLPLVPLPPPPRSAIVRRQVPARSSP